MRIILSTLIAARLLLSHSAEETLNEILRKALTQSSLRRAWAENARHYADTQDLYSLPEKAADIITGGLDG